MHLIGIAGLIATLSAAAAVFAGPAIGAVPIEFILFGIVLASVAVFHHHTLAIAMTGAAVIALYKMIASPFATGSGIAGFGVHLTHEWVILTNLLLLLLGFALLARHFEDSRMPAALPQILPDDWKGGFFLLSIIFALSAFLDNIAAALIGGAIAHTVFKGKVHIGYLAAIVAASNAGGAGSVIGDTTTTMMWIAGVPPTEVIEAVLGAVPALLIFGIPASIVQQKYSPIETTAEASMVRVDWPRVAVVGSILASALIVNVTINTSFSEYSDRAPFLGLAVWAAILGTAFLRRPQWKLLPNALKGSLFLLSLVLCASMMPVDKLPAAGWPTTFGLGFLSAVFDNIPLTALTLAQGGYDWGFLAYAVGFGGSMIWFGSSAGVALSSMYPEMRNAGMYLKKGWLIAVGYVVGFMIMLQLLGFHPGTTPRTAQPAGGASAVEATH